MSNVLDDITEMAKEDGREEGREEGRVEGEDKLARLIRILLDQGRYEDVSKVASDVEFRNKLYAEEEIA